MMMSTATEGTPPLSPSQPSISSGLLLLTRPPELTHPPLPPACPHLSSMGLLPSPSCAPGPREGALLGPTGRRGCRASTAASPHPGTSHRQNHTLCSHSTSELLSFVRRRGDLGIWGLDKWVQNRPKMCYFGM